MVIEILSNFGYSVE